MLKQASKHLLVASALGALFAPGMALAGGEPSDPPAARAIYDTTWPDGIAPGREGAANVEGAWIAGAQYDPTWPGGIAPGDEGLEQGRGVRLSGTRYDATWPDGIAPGGRPARAEELHAAAREEPNHAGTRAAR